MYCKNCGANISPNESECSFCGTKVERLVETIESAPISTTTTLTQPQNPLIGKEYSFSGNDLVIKGRWGVRFKVTVGEDRLYFETVPARKNKLPAIMLDDILAIEESFHMRKINILMAILGFCFGFAAPFCFVFPLFVLLFYRERKAKIHIRNGQILTIYSDNKSTLQNFVEDMKKITKIKQ